MQQDINLIPTSSRTTQELSRKTSGIEAVLKILFVFLTISLLTIAVIYGILYSGLSEAKKEREKLTQELVALKKSEARLVVLRDRLTKVAFLRNKYDISGEYAILNDLLQNTTSPTQLVKFSMNPESVEAVITTESSLGMTKLLSHLVGSGLYSRVVMKSFEYSPSTAYRMELLLGK